MKSLLLTFLLAVGCGVAAALTREYIFNSALSGWLDAKAYCRQYYRDLANVTTMEENKRLLQSGSASESWLGLRVDVSTLSVSMPTIFTNWCPACPNKAVTCVYINPLGFWNTAYCKNLKSFYCYRFLVLVNETKTWKEAQQYCRTYYTGLASVTSESSLKQLNLETVGMQTESVWTGLSFVNGVWLWVTGEPLGSLVSMSSCPAPSYRCGALDTTTNTLQNQNCNDKLNFVCYWT